MDEAEKLRLELARTNKVLGTLITWLARDLGTAAVLDLTRELNVDIEEWNGAGE